MRKRRLPIHQILGCQVTGSLLCNCVLIAYYFYGCIFFFSFVSRISDKPNFFATSTSPNQFGFEGFLYGFEGVYTSISSYTYEEFLHSRDFNSKQNSVNLTFLPLFSISKIRNFGHVVEYLESKWFLCNFCVTFLLNKATLKMILQKIRVKLNFENPSLLWRIRRP